METNHNQWKEISGRLEDLFKKNAHPEKSAIREILNKRSPENIALALENIQTEKAIVVFKEIDRQNAPDILSKLNAELAGKIIKHFNPDELTFLLQQMGEKEAAGILAESSEKQKNKVQEEGYANPLIIEEAEKKKEYRPNQAGRLMTTYYVKSRSGATIRDCVKAIRRVDRKYKIPEDIFIVKETEDHAEKYTLKGVISIRDLLTYHDDAIVDDVMAKDVVCIGAEASLTDAAAILSKYKFQTLPVVDKDRYLVGVIPVNDLLEIMTGRISNMYNKAVGTDAQKMAKLNPFQEAKMRVPWLLGTMVIELIAGLVISKFDDILQRVILLASFMPVISAISGNVGLQAAAITVRAVDSKVPGGHNLLKAVRKEIFTSLLMALACGFVLGTVGALWAKHIPFGLVIGGALICSMLTAGLMGTIIPIFSKRLGFDPATTAGPFETAFQDIVGFGMFLWLATIFQEWIT